MVKVNYASLQTQSSTMSSASQSRVAGFNQLISAFDSFGGSGGELIGTGYDAARAYATSVMSPYYKGCILYSEAVADAANTLADSYVAKCGAENLDEEQLQAEIDSATRGCMSLSASISGLQSKSKPAAGDAARISSLQNQLTAAQNQLTATQEKLANLRAFSAESLLACTSADTYQLLISQAMSGISVSFGGGGFALPEDLTWVSDVEQGWADREIALENNYWSALDKVYNGESLTEAELTAIERYAAAYPERVDASVLEYVQQARQVKAEEMKYRSIIDKVDNGTLLNDEDKIFIEDFKKKHPDFQLHISLEKAIQEENLYEKLIVKDKKGEELNKEELNFLEVFYKKHPSLSIPHTISKKLKAKKFYDQIDRYNLAELEEKYKGLINEYSSYRQTGKFFPQRKGLTPIQIEYIYFRHQFLTSLGDTPLDEKQRNNKMFENLRDSDKKEIDELSAGELSSRHIEFMNSRIGLELDYLMMSDADKAKKDYSYYRFNQLMKEQPIDWRDPNYITKRNAYILETGKNPSTNEPATEAEIITAKNYGWVKAIPDTVAWTDMMVGSYVGYQVYNGKPIYGLDTDFAGRIKIPSTRIQPVVKPQPAPKNLDVDGPVVNNIQSKYPDLQTYEYNSYTNPGPLNDLRGQPNVNFYGGRYDVEVLKSPKILYRAGDQSNPLGQWFTESAPHSEIEVRINTAVKPIWTDRSGNYTGSSPLNTVYEIKIPAGTTIYRGPVASQGGIYQGGLEYEQIFIETPWKIEGVEVISSKPLN